MLYETEDGNVVEGVLMRYSYGNTLCISTQAGCRMGCVFCATGQGGFTRSLKATEIYDQVMHVSEDFQTRASSVVMMGQGEPFNNYDEVIKALRMLNSPEGAGIRHSVDQKRDHARRQEVHAPAPPRRHGGVR